MSLTSVWSGRQGETGIVVDWVVNHVLARGIPTIDRGKLLFNQGVVVAGDYQGKNSSDFCPIGPPVRN
jgi:hypothetical protein